MGIKETDRRKVWVRCGGRCVICNRYLLDDGLVGKEVSLTAADPAPEVHTTRWLAPGVVHLLVSNTRQDRIRFRPAFGVQPAASMRAINRSTSAAAS